MQVDLIVNGTDGLQDGSVVSTDGSNSVSLDLSQVIPGNSVKVHLRTTGGFQISTCTFTAPTHCLASLDNVNFSNTITVTNLGVSNTPIYVKQSESVSIEQSQDFDFYSAYLENDLEDVQAPAQVTGLGAVSRTTTSIELSCNASTDNVAVNGYEWYRTSNGGAAPETNTAPANTTVNPTTTHSGLTANTQYDFYVRAIDAAGNKGAWSNVFTYSTLAYVFEDAFNRADSTNLGANWIEHTNSNVTYQPAPNWSITSNQLTAAITATGVGSKCTVTSSGMADTANQIVEATVVQEVTGTSARGGIVARHGGGTDDDPNTLTQCYYLVQIHGSGRIYLQKIVNNAATAYTSASAGPGYTLTGTLGNQYVSWTPQAGDRLRLSAIGTSVKVYAKHPAGDWELLIDAIDNEANKITTGKAGLWTYTTTSSVTATFEDFVIS